jgi:phosphate-selective porin OprO/OprP
MRNVRVAVATLLATTALSSALFAAPAAAADNAATTAAQIQMLQDQLRNLQQQLDGLKAADESAKDAIAREAKERIASTNAITNAAPAPAPKVTESATHRFTLSSADGAWTIAPTGRIHFDVGGYLDQKAQSTTGVGTDAGGRLTSGLNVRRARLGVTGKAMNDFTYSLILDGGGSTDNATLINTASIGYTGIANTIIEVGYMASYFTLDETTSSNDIIFLERATPAAVTAGINVGDPRANLGFRTWGPNWWFGAYLTGSKPGDTHALTQRTLGAYTRATYQIVQNSDYSVHIGGGVDRVFRAPNSGPNTAESLTLANQPELRIDPTNSITTGALGTVTNPVDKATIYGVEAAATFDQFFAQGEAYHYNINRIGRPAAEFDGAYAQITYTIGGKHNYTVNCGCYSGVNPTTPFSPLKGGTGAVEFALRYSYIDLTDQFNSSVPTAAQPLGVNGGRQGAVTAGINWYWNSNMLWKLNYIHTNLIKAVPRVGGGPGVGAGLAIDALAARWQVMF